MFYVSIDGIDDDLLAFLGYVLVAEEGDFKLYRDYSGDEHIVDKTKPYLFVEDPNDASLLADRSGSKTMVNTPKKRH